MMKFSFLAAVGLAVVSAAPEDSSLLGDAIVLTTTGDVYTTCLEVEKLKLQVTQTCEQINVFSYCLARTQHDLSAEQVLFHRAEALKFCQLHTECDINCYDIHWDQGSEGSHPEGPDGPGSSAGGVVDISNEMMNLHSEYFEEYTSCVGELPSQSPDEGDYDGCEIIDKFAKCESKIKHDNYRDVTHVSNGNVCKYLGCDCSFWDSSPDLSSFHDCQAEQMFSHVFGGFGSFGSIDWGEWGSYDFGDFGSWDYWGSSGSYVPYGSYDSDMSECYTSNITECQNSCSKDLDYCDEGKCKVSCFNDASDMCYHFNEISYQMAFPECYNSTGYGSYDWGSWGDVGTWEGWNGTDYGSWDGIDWGSYDFFGSFDWGTGSYGSYGDMIDWGSYGSWDSDSMCSFFEMAEAMTVCYVDHKEDFGSYYDSFLQVEYEMCESVSSDAGLDANEECSMDCKWYHEQMNVKPTGDDGDDTTGGGGSSTGGTGGDDGSDGSGDVDVTISGAPLNAVHAVVFVTGAAVLRHLV